MLNLIQIHLRTHRFFLLAWLTPLTLFFASMPSAYSNSYTDAESLAKVREQMSNSFGLVVIYGKIPEPFNYATWTVWETTSWGFILAAIMGLLLGSSVSRGLEESGQAELLQSNGLSAGVLRRAALTVTILTSVLWGVCDTPLHRYTKNGSLWVGGFNGESNLF
ncbi:MAG: hypothetical protein ACFNPV_11415, partial [Corynebacterium matruchotii]